MDFQKGLALVGRQFDSIDGRDATYSRGQTEISVRCHPEKVGELDLAPTVPVSMTIYEVFLNRSELEAGSIYPPEPDDRIEITGIGGLKVIARDVLGGLNAGSNCYAFVPGSTARISICCVLEESV